MSGVPIKVLLASLAWPGGGLAETVNYLASICLWRFALSEGASTLANNKEIAYPRKYNLPEIKGTPKKRALCAVGVHSLLILIEVGITSYIPTAPSSELMTLHHWHIYPLWTNILEFRFCGF